MTPSPSRSNALAVAHARFARAALGIYLAAAAVSVALLVGMLISDKAHHEDQISERLLLETDLRAHALGQRLDLLVNELRRLSLRSEVNLRDQELSPDESLLQISHERSAFFNVGVAILDKKGDVVSSVPQGFLGHDRNFGAERWFGSVRRRRAFRIVPVRPTEPGSVLYVVSPLLRNQEFRGALLGAVDLAAARALPLSGQAPVNKALTVVATRDGTVVYPPVPPAFTREAAWKSLFMDPESTPDTTRLVLEGQPHVVASSPVPNADLVVLSVGTTKELFWESRTRLRNGLSAGLALALTPALLLLLVLRRSLKLFRKSEEDALREERLRLLGEAANSIAHEVKNALNSLSMGLDLVARTFHVTAGQSPPSSRAASKSPTERRERIMGELRREIQRLSEFTTELMSFSRGVEPRRAKLDLAEYVPKVTSLIRDAAEEAGATIDIITPGQPVFVEADSALLHAVISNLTGNAVDAATADSPAPRVEVRLEAEGREAHLRVSDNGRGVSPTMRGRLFEPFQAEKPSGVGIGLALARKIARAHSGDLVLDEAMPRRPEFPGASFVLTLPILMEEPEDS